MSREISYEPVIHTGPDGRQTLLVLPAIPDHAPEPIREGIARRRVTALTGHCPCGAGVRVTRQQRRAKQRQAAKRRPIRAEVWHEPGCPAADDILVELIREWAAVA